MNRAYLAIRQGTLRLLKVPAEPHPPAGSPGSLRVFRAGTNQYRLSLALWVVRQVLVVVGLLIGLWFVTQIARGESWFPEDSPPDRWVARQHAWASRAGLLPWLAVFETLGFLTALANGAFSYVVLRLQYEMHWYLVTDRSLRIRHGVKSVRELTLSFANIQQITIRQGPLQRWLGLADVVVTTAGGGGSTQPTQGHASAEDPCHVGILRSVEGAEAIRDLMLERLRNLRSSGLGDPDEAGDALPGHPGSVGTRVGSPAGPGLGGIPAVSGVGSLATLAAAREVLGEVRALRAAWVGTGSDVDRFPVDPT